MKKKVFTLAEDTGIASENISLSPLRAFTLAEVLITLTIIGVIAAITVPTLIQSTNKQEYVTALKKAYSTLSQATNMIIAEEGSPMADENGASWADTSMHIYEQYKKHLNVIKECTKDTEKDCFFKGIYKYYSGNSFADFKTSYLSSANPKIVLSDGISVMFHDTRNTICTLGNADDGTETDICDWIAVDVNGQKGPNKAGMDLHWFVLKKDGLHPRNCSKMEQCPGGTAVKGGHDCSCKVLSEGAINY